MVIHACNIRSCHVIPLKSAVHDKQNGGKILQEIDEVVFHSQSKTGKEFFAIQGWFMENSFNKNQCF